ncbi:hypothetical protein XELAEV_18016964mg [Xenopus laevis]|uniref:Uncharacterized protein n=1 Tax=Xenopus laevis TaxID=8355 RepID=A0A974DBJ2_XENLA|nr:hypothetical protein XELAEV_18016964mg [Xenopus laevis]
MQNKADCFAPHSNQLSMNPTPAKGFKKCCLLRGLKEPFNSHVNIAHSTVQLKCKATLYGNTGRWRNLDF